MTKNRSARAISLLCAAALIAAVIIRNETVSTALIFICAAASLFILYRKLPELSNISPENPKAKTLRSVTIFNIIIFAGLAFFAYLAKNEYIRLTEQSASYIMPVIFAVLIFIFGNISPKLPHNRYTGLRLPWTVADESTWLIAHRILGYLALPCSLLCFAGIGDPEASLRVPLIMLFVWILIPSILSYIHYRKKWYMK